MWQSSHLQTYN